MPCTIQPHEPGTIFVPCGIAGMGWAPPAAVRPNAAPGPHCVSVSSDGGFAMQNHVLTTALQYDAPVTFVVMNDAQLGMVRQGQGDRPIAEYIALIGPPWRMATAAGAPSESSRGYSTGSIRGPEWPETCCGGRHHRSQRAHAGAPAYTFRSLRELLTRCDPGATWGSARSG